MGKVPSGKGCVELARGYNSYREYYHGCCYGRHAETDAICKLEKNPFDKYNKYKKGSKKINVDLIVISVSKTGVLSNSKPCAKCIHHLSKMKYHKVKNVFYSTPDGIVQIKFTQLLTEISKHISYRFRT